jgi:condensation enzyme
MTKAQHEQEENEDQFPLSFTQEFFCSFDQGDQGGAFGFRFITVSGLRITGQVDVLALSGALADVVERHEMLRTTIARDAIPPYQQVHPPCPVPLEVRDLPPTADRSRNVRAEELIIEAEQVPVNPRQVPLLRAVFGRFDDRDSVLVLSAHHSACDGWAMQVIIRDMAAFYASRRTGQPTNLPEVRQYREYAARQRAGLADPMADGTRAYWRKKLAGARVFALPNDRPRPELYSQPYSVHNYLIESDVITPAAALAASTRSSLFMVLLAAFNVMAYRINGTTDPAIRAFTSGRTEPEFQETMGPFMNLVPFRTDISDCRTFREIVERTRDTCVEAYEYEIPINHVEQELPEFNQPHSEPRMSQFILGMFQPQFDSGAMKIAEGAHEILERELPEPEHPDIPSGLVWNMVILPSNQLTGGILYNLDEFDEATVIRWVAEFSRILTTTINSPEQAWLTL